MKKFVRFLLNLRYGYKLPTLIKSKEWKINPTDRICILAPHADDESIGCGGLLAKYAQQCDVILLTDGTPDGDEAVRKIREEEFVKVMEFFGIKNYSFMRAKDGRLVEAYGLFEKIDFSDYTYVVMPHGLDSHKDHVVPQAFFRRLKKEKGFKAIPVYYEVWGAMAQPTNYIDISDVTDKKREAIHLYSSQSNIDYAGRILALNHYRGIRHSVEEEEDYFIDR